MHVFISLLRMYGQWQRRRCISFKIFCPKAATEKGNHKEESGSDNLYSPITAVLMNGAGEPLGKREVNLLDNEPHMPTLQAMHRALAKHPMLQVELFLLLDDLVHTELCCMNGFIGVRRSALKPLDAQGRGFTHGHEKIISVPQTRAARLKQLFTRAAATERLRAHTPDLGNFLLGT